MEQQQTDENAWLQKSQSAAGRETRSVSRSFCQPFSFRYAPLQSLAKTLYHRTALIFDQFGSYVFTTQKKIESLKLLEDEVWKIYNDN